ncbi:MAG TPA: LLM class flavin-dependent oxidoreductase [Gaiellales bacterium]|nr:LLM class flavin-dependent oxidoreductase [Gaiellales bacterium]
MSASSPTGPRRPHPVSSQPDERSGRLEFGAHLPLIDFGTRASLRGLKEYARAAAALGYGFLCANDHLLFARPWIDGPTALAAVIEDSGDMALATTVSLPVMRGPVQLAKTLAAIDVLSEGRLVAGVGPGSSTRDIGLEPASARDPGPPIWIASWGAPAGLRRAARHGDGWLASAYNTTPDTFGAHRGLLARIRDREGGARPFATAVATAWMYVTEDGDEAERMLADVLSPMLSRPVEALRALSLPIGPAQVCAERLSAFARAGAERLFVWPLADDVRQLEVFREQVVPLASV